ncbi:MAG: Gfo/Idh/MocA family oxidoreductase [Isosphaeraceae bacterium]
MRLVDRRIWMRRTTTLLAASAWPRAGRGAVSSDGRRPEPIRIGQIGVRHAHATKLSIYRESPDYEVVGIVEPDDQAWKQASTKPAFHGLNRLTREQLLNTPRLQAVLVETQVSDLLENAAVCVNAGMHVHLDKPAGESLSRYRQLLEEATRRKLWVQMGYMYRYNPAVVALREAVQRGWLGTIFEVDAVMSKTIGPEERAALARYPGGIMFELGCHVIDLVIGILGAPRQIAPYPRHSSKQDDRLPDNMLAVFEYPRATATVRSSAIEVDGFARRHLVVCGTEGTFHVQPLDDPAARVTFSSARGPYQKGYQTLNFPRYTRYVADAADMARVIRGEKAADFSPSHDLAVQSAVLRASGLTID